MGERTAMKSVKVRNKIKEMFTNFDRPLNTTEIYDHLNRTTKNGVTGHQLAALLNSDPDIVFLKRVTVRSYENVKYSVSLWEMKRDEF
jgi:spore coat protein CotF